MIPHHMAAIYMCENLLKYTKYMPWQKIARNIITFNAQSKTENSKSIIEITVSTGKNAENPTFSKTIKYVLKYW